MTRRAFALAAAAAAIALVLAQVAYPRSTLYHTWQYAAALGILLAVLAAYAKRALRGGDGPPGRGFALAALGAAITGLAGLASGLLGPDTAIIAGVPGTVVPVPALGAAAFFSAGGADAIAHGTGSVTLRRRGKPEIALSGAGRSLLGESLVYLEKRPVVSIDARDARGEHVTITQPSGSAFLSPVLLLRERQRIGAFSVPFDTFAVPGAHRIVRVLFFTAAELAAFRHASPDPAGPSVVLSASDDAGHPLGIALGATGADVRLAGLRLRVTAGTFPALAIAAAPEPWALGAGLALVAAGLLWAAALRRGPLDHGGAVAHGDQAGNLDRRPRERSDDVEVV